MSLIITSVLTVFKSDPGLVEDALQRVNAAVLLSTVVFNYLAKAVVKAAYAQMVFGLRQWHYCALVYHYRLNLHNQGAPVKDPEDLPCGRMRSV